MLLAKIIIQKIQKEGPISFHDFMEMVLYYPALGYYNALKITIGKEGDFYTSPHLTSAFGAMIARQIEQMWRITDEEAFTIVEYGAGTGILCHDILDYLKSNKKLYDGLCYRIIEKSAVMKQRQQTHLHEKVSWHNSIHEIPAITGCVLSNELIDNFSVHQVVMEEELMEVFVGYNNGFVELLQPASKVLKEYMAELDVQLPKGFRTEINLEVQEWLKEIAVSLKKGWLLTIDYGCSSAELYSQRRNCGTVVCYNQHQVNENPYHDIGKQDITAHVNFSALCHWGLKNGLTCCGLTTQTHFLVALGFKDYLIKTIDQENDIMKMVKKEAFLSYTLLVDMGNKFKVLIQRKGIGTQPLLGLKF